MYAGLGVVIIPFYRTYMVPALAWSRQARATTGMAQNAIGPNNNGGGRENLTGGNTQGHGGAHRNIQPLAINCVCQIASNANIGVLCRLIKQIVQRNHAV